jgi:hypothetical protein
MDWGEARRRLNLPRAVPARPDDVDVALAELPTRDPDGHPISWTRDQVAHLLFLRLLRLNADGALERVTDG